MWSGPSSSMTYSGTPRPCSAESSWREVFQSSPAPIADGGLDQRVEQQVHDVGGGLEAAAEVDRADHRLDGVGEDRGLVAAAGGLLAAAELDVLAEADRARPTSASARALTTAARSLASRPSERSGWRAVERLGDDHAEHRVTEELQALVGGQAAVLVGERAVREGALEQLGVQVGIPERRAQLRRSWSAVPVRSGSEDLATVGAGAVLAALAARAVRQVLGTAGGVGAGHQGRRDGLPLRATVARVAARHLPLRDSHCVLLASRARSRSSAGWSLLELVPGSPSAGRSPPRVRGPGRPPAAHHTRRTVRDSRPRTAAGTAVRAPPRPAAAARGRAGRPRAG